jgi:fructose-1,6-bisphosphatase/inositol monophosphatase family enzyme
VRAGGDAFELDAVAAGPVRVRVRHTPYWDVVGGDACVARASGGWTEVRVRRPGRVVVRARFTLSGALRSAGC